MHLLVCILAILPSFWILCYMSYKYYRLWKQIQKIQEQQIYHQFNGDPEKIRFYKGFKKYFDGELNIDELEHWFKHHPSKTKPA